MESVSVTDSKANKSGNILSKFLKPSQELMLIEKLASQSFIKLEINFNQKLIKTIIIYNYSNLRNE